MQIYWRTILILQWNTMLLVINWNHSFQSSWANIVFELNIKYNGLLGKQSALSEYINVMSALADILLNTYRPRIEYEKMSSFYCLAEKMMTKYNSRYWSIRYFFLNHIINNILYLFHKFFFFLKLNILLK